MLRPPSSQTGSESHRSGWVPNCWASTRRCFGPCNGEGRPGTYSVETAPAPAMVAVEVPLRSELALSSLAACAIRAMS